MINSNIKTCSVKRATSTLDDYGQYTANTYSTIATVKLSICYAGQELANNPRFETVEYIGSYFGTPVDFKKGDLVDEKYIIVEVINAGRLTYLYMEVKDE